MKYIDEFRNKCLIDRVSREIRQMMPKGEINLMEVCGTHTQSFFRFGLDKLLPDNLRLIAGPGCPVCVSSQGYIDAALNLARHKDIVIVTFGDMLRVPGSRATLEEQRAKLGNVRVVYSASESMVIARANPDKKVVFLAVGFETTAPTIALTISLARKEKIKNLFFFSSLKLIPPAMACLVRDKRLKLHGFLCPGHVSAIIGTKPYEFIAKKYKIGCCVAGFEPLDILEGVYLLLRQIKRNKPAIDNQYARVVTRRGNRQAQKIMRRFFRVSDADWRGIGRIPDSGLQIRPEYAKFDAGKAFGIKLTTHNSQLTTQCRCGDILKGIISPKECPLFAKACRPDKPVGPCMVSREGACNAYYRYR